MPRPPRRIAALALAALLAIGATASLDGCTLARTVVDGASGGSVDIGGTTIPDGFPVTAVPLVDGDVVFGTGVKGSAGRGWNVSIAVDGPEVWTEVERRLVERGFTEDEVRSGSDGASGLFVKTPYTVAVLIARQDSASAWTATYTVRTATPSPQPEG